MYLHLAFLIIKTKLWVISILEIIITFIVVFIQKFFSVEILAV